MGMIKHFAGRLANTVLHSIGCEVIKHSASVSWRSTFARIRGRRIEIQTVIDVGASDGRWSKTLMLFYPYAFYFLIEANQVHESKLKRFKKKHENVDYILAAAGDTVGEVYFDASDAAGGLASHKPMNSDNMIKVAVVTVDTQVKQQNLTGPYLLKLDTHGFEVPIFEGATATLKETSIIVVEAYNFVLSEGSLRFHEMCLFLEEKGFRPLGLCNPMFRPKDGLLWQMDLIFARSDRKEFLSNAYN
ncbi:MAG: FkbM family methyltransferase [Desulfobacterales bacterium]|nr:FkbM family methyltransferase [Desulfobacterales bacterium]